MKIKGKELKEGDTILHSRYGYGNVFDILSDRSCIIMLYDKTIQGAYNKCIKLTKKKLKIRL